MTFEYTYRSSDGLRHTAEIEAENRDAAFAKVRAEMGVKPIKVVASGAAVSTKPPRPKLFPIPYSLFLAAIAAAIAAWLLRPGADVGAPSERNAEAGVYRQETRDAFLKLLERAGALEDRCRAELKLLRLDNLRNYAWIERERDLSPLYRELDKAQSIIDYTRAQARDLFRDVYKSFPSASANERTDAQRRYGRLMDAMDAEEERMQSEHLMLLLLDDNRAAWHADKGSIAFTDAKVEEDFKFYSRPTDGSTARWKRDFGRTAVESRVIESPAASPNRSPDQHSR